MGAGVTDAAQITGVTRLPLRVIEDSRGAVLHMLRENSPVFRRFGEVYFSEINPGAIKAWKRHRRMTQNLAVPVGLVKFVLYDDRSNSETRGRTAVHVVGRPDAYVLLVVPPRVWYGFQGLGSAPSIVANCTDLPHDPEEAEQQAEFPGGGPFAW